jgi:hypothetical protein
MTPPSRTALTFHLMNGALLAIVTAIIFVDASASAPLTALVAVTWLSVLLIVPRIMYASKLKRFHADLLEIAKQSKWLGLWLFVWFSGYVLLASATEALQPKAMLLAVLAELILVVLALISNQWSYQRVTYWKQINMAVWALPVLLAGHFLVAQHGFVGQMPLLFSMLALLTLTTLAGLATLLQAVKKKPDWWRLMALTASGLVTCLIIVFY